MAIEKSPVTLTVEAETAKEVSTASTAAVDAPSTLTTIKNALSTLSVMKKTPKLPAKTNLDGSRVGCDKLDVSTASKVPVELPVILTGVAISPMTFTTAATVTLTTLTAMKEIPINSSKVEERLDMDRLELLDQMHLPKRLARPELPDQCEPLEKLK